ncbi:hypothetical protein [Flavobacterium sp.]|uniref:hypothetical protein n=1 Tax=Flavobacterium sp. TaxID=239 RepID=UPI00248720D2|nr:hypothetical protein [Flavobacterium sp.]MDI1316138.1 hypothetical protein [Flavobacterium sp.]
MVNLRLRFARNSILVENNSFRSSQLTRNSGTLGKIPERISPNKRALRPTRRYALAQTPAHSARLLPVIILAPA